MFLSPAGERTDSPLQLPPVQLLYYPVSSLNVNIQPTDNIIRHNTPGWYSLISWIVTKEGFSIMTQAQCQNTTSLMSLFICSNRTLQKLNLKILFRVIPSVDMKHVCCEEIET